MKKEKKNLKRNRRTWEIDPSTRVTPSKKKYNRQKNKVQKYEQDDI